MSDSALTASRRQFLCAIAGLPITIATPSLYADSPRPSNKWRIEFSEGANSDGVITFLLTPETGHGQIIKAEIPDGTSENHVARMVRDAFRSQLEPKHYKIEIDDGEDVLVKRKHGQADFVLELVSSGVKSVRIHIQRE